MNALKVCVSAFLVFVHRAAALDSDRSSLEHKLGELASEVAGLKSVKIDLEEQLSKVAASSEGLADKVADLEKQLDKLQKRNEDLGNVGGGSVDDALYVHYKIVA
jgi:septal ring factor EnvC (AmiA/AmiB activator)